MEAGTPGIQVREEIEKRWNEWVAGGNVDVTPMPPELQRAVSDVFHMAREGKSPAACAVVYRSLAREYPERHWLERWAKIWEGWGDKWQELAPIPDESF
jgi:hypothetical protein